MSAGMPSLLDLLHISHDELLRIAAESGITAELVQSEPEPPGVVVARCPCGETETRFDPADAHLDEYEVRRRWPRGHCPRCNCIVYASSLHFVAGDW